MAAQQDTPSGSINVRVEYKIEEDLPEKSVRDGWVKIEDMKVERSFLRFEKEDEAKAVHKNLSKLQGVSFLKSYFIIEHQEHYWLAVDKIQYSLETYKKQNSKIWNGTRLISQYQDIIRGIIIGMCELHGQRYTHGSLSIEDILIVNDKPKFAYIRNEFRPPLEGDNECPIHKENLDQDFKDLKVLFKKVIGTYYGHDELSHFYERAEVNNALNLSKLYFHPILMAPMERFFQPVRMDTLGRYPGHEKASKDKDRENDWIKKVERDYKKIITYADDIGRPYLPNVWDLFKFLRNAIVHINESLRSRESTKRKTEEDVEKELSTMFPDSFNEVYDLFDLKEIASGSRATHLESPTKDKQKKRTRQQSPGRSPKRTRLDHNLNLSRSETSPHAQMRRPPPSSSRHR
ncbi:hypothetical protein ACSBR2_014126 [Camellia fascicularis]